MLGRTQKSERNVYHDRIIDIDLLLYDKEIIQTPELTLPHPLMLQREFVMKPLLEIAREIEHPEFGKTFGELYEEMCGKIC